MEQTTKHITSIVSLTSSSNPSHCKINFNGQPDRYLPHWQKWLFLPPFVLSQQFGHLGVLGTQIVGVLEDETLYTSRLCFDIHFNGNEVDNKWLTSPVWRPLLRVS